MLSSRFSVVARRLYSTGPILKGKSVLSATQFDRPAIERVLEVAKEFREALKTRSSVDVLPNKILGNIFLEPSTRTASSFEAAMNRLGGRTILVNAATSSFTKGETLDDTVRVMENYCDVIVIRHPQVGSVSQAAAVASVPVLNAGDGAGEHPTQALLDLFCMKTELGTLDGLTITFVGDMKYGRTVHSLSRLLSNFNVRINFVSPPELPMPAYHIDQLKAKGMNISEHNKLEALIPQTDVLYVTRIQQERFPTKEEYLKLKGSFVVSPATLQQAKKKMIVMHPLPRVDELTYDLDRDSRAVYFKQPGYGMHTRMALLSMVLGAR